MEAYLALFLLLGLFVLWPVSLVSACRFDEGAYRAIGRTKAGTVLLVVLVGSVAGAYYWLRIRPQLRSVEMVS